MRRSGTRSTSIRCFLSASTVTSRFLRLGLEQGDGADVVAVRRRRLREGGAARHGAGDGAAPVLVFGERDGQFDHRLALQRAGGDAVENVRRPARSRREFDDGAGVHAPLHFARQAGDGVMRLVHDHQRAVEAEQVGEGVFESAVLQPRQAGRRMRQRGEMRLQVLVVGIDLAAFGVLDAQGLDGADDDAATAADVVRAQLREVGDVEHAGPPVERRVERAPVGVAGVLERLRRLAADDVGGREPEDQRIFLLDPRLARHGDGVRGEEGLAAAGGQAEADVRRVRQSLERPVGAGEPAEPRRAFGRAHRRRVGRRRAGDARLLEESAQAFQRFGLVGFELHRYARAFTS